MAESTRILARLLDDCWEPDSTIQFLREQVGCENPALDEAVPYCLVVPDGDVRRARVVDAEADIDDTLPPDGTRYLWVLAVGVPSREDLLRICAQYGIEESDRGS